MPEQPEPAGFVAAVVAVGGTADPATHTRVTTELLARWSEPQRAYHDRRHLAEVLSALAVLGESDPVAVLAAWFHDAVYQPRESDNEARSAALAEALLAGLGVPEATVTDVSRLVTESATHQMSGSGVADSFHDADLWILSAPTARFDEYCTDVRGEYAHVGDQAYATARSEILAGFAARTELYRTGHARAEWTQAARDNLARELGRLGHR